MKVMLTPPDLWGTTGYVGAAAGAGAGTRPSSSEGSDQVYKERGEMDIQWSICNSDNKETENIILTNRQRQVNDDSASALYARERERREGDGSGLWSALLPYYGEWQEEGGGRKEEASADEFDMLVYIGIVDVFSISL